MDVTCIKKLRKETGLSLVDIKRELEKNKGDYTRTLAALNTLIKPQSRVARVASKGLVSLKIKDHIAVILDITAETDFAGKNSHFIALFDTISDLLFETRYPSVEALEKAEINDVTVSEYIANIATKVSENISIRRFERIKKDVDHVFGSYRHHDGKSACLLVLNQPKKDLAKMIAMQAIAMDAQYIDYRILDQSSLAALKKEYDLYQDIFGSFQAYLTSKSLLDQPTIHDQNQTVGALLKEHDAHIVSLVRYGLGEGIKDKLMCRLDLTEPHQIFVSPLLNANKKT